MADIKLTEDNNYFGYDYYKRAMECVSNDARELRDLLRYRSKSMIDANKTRALCDIECAMENLKELKAAIMEVTE